MNDPRPKMALRSLIQSHDNALNGDWHISAREDCLRLNAGQRIVCNQTISSFDIVHTFTPRLFVPKSPLMINDLYEFDDDLSFVIGQGPCSRAALERIPESGYYGEGHISRRKVYMHMSVQKPELETA